MLIRQGAMPLRGALSPCGFSPQCSYDFTRPVASLYCTLHFCCGIILQPRYLRLCGSKRWPAHCTVCTAPSTTLHYHHILLLRSEGPYKLHSRRPLYNHSALILWQFTACMYHIQCAITFSEIMLESAHSNHPQNGRMAKFQKGKILCSNVWSLINKKSVKTSASAFYVQCSMKSYFSQRCVEEIDQLIKRRPGICSASRFFFFIKTRTLVREQL